MVLVRDAYQGEEWSCDRCTLDNVSEIHWHCAEYVFHPKKDDGYDVCLECLPISKQFVQREMDRIDDKHLSILACMNYLMGRCDELENKLNEKCDEDELQSCMSEISCVAVKASSEAEYLCENVAEHSEMLKDMLQSQSNLNLKITHVLNKVIEIQEDVDWIRNRNWFGWFSW